ncbi:MAG: hypothetical protein IIC01_02915, partial [Planctomycetes bacterium]|nr:hypothetical protein [Planctomycetota bacterium]
KILNERLTQIGIPERIIGGLLFDPLNLIPGLGFGPVDTIRLFKGLGALRRGAGFGDEAAEWTIRVLRENEISLLETMGAAKRSPIPLAGTGDVLRPIDDAFAGAADAFPTRQPGVSVNDVELPGFDPSSESTEFDAVMTGQVSVDGFEITFAEVTGTRTRCELFGGGCDTRPLEPDEFGEVTWTRIR